MKLFKNNRLVWGLLCGGYMVYIFIFSFLFPYGMDEYYFHTPRFLTLVERYVNMFMYHNTKIGLVVTSLMIFAGKWVFLVLNPLVQLGIVFAMFYFVFMRLPDFKDTKDVAVFLLLAILSVFGVAVPDNTIFWISGAVNYSWTFFLFLIAFCILRGLYEGKVFFKDTVLSRIIAVIAGIAIGMSNENNAPMAFVIFTCFFILMKFIKKQKLPAWFYFCFAGIAAGLVVLFFGPGMRNRMRLDSVGFSAAALKEKMFFHINHMDNFIKCNLLLPAVNFLLLLILGIDWDKRAFKNKDYVLSLCCYIVSWVLVAVLFAAPDTGWRPFYSATVLSILSFVFLLKYLAEEYKISLIKYFAMLAFILAVVIFPLVAMPYISLYNQSVEREYALAQAKAKGEKGIYLPYFLVERGPLANFTIVFFDAIYVTPLERLNYFKMQVVPVKNLPLLQDENVQITTVY